MISDFERCYRAVESRDRRFDGWFVTAVTSTGIYCRPSCPARTPARRHVRFHPTAAAAQAEGFRACKRCRPDASPGSPGWDARGDVVARAVRLIADGAVDREGVAGLAGRVGYSERHLNRLFRAEVGAGPLALARAQRSQTARTLIETTELPMAQVAFAAGFASVRQFNETVRAVFATTPGALRRRRRRCSTAAAAAGADGAAVGPCGAGGGVAIALRLPYREPLDWTGLVTRFAAHAVPGVEEVVGSTYRRTLRLPHDAGIAELSPADGHVACLLRLADVRDLGAAVQRCRRLLDLDADPVAVDEVLRADPALSAAVAVRPGLRVARTVDPVEVAIRAVLSQQVSVATARGLGGVLVQRLGTPLAAADGGLTHLFPDAPDLAGADPAALPLPGARGRALLRVAEALADGNLVLDVGADRGEAAEALLRVPGVGPWTVSVIRMRGLGDPDVLPSGDLALRRGAARLGLPEAPSWLDAAGAAWAPWRSYAAQHLWATAASAVPATLVPTGSSA